MNASDFGFASSKIFAIILIAACAGVSWAGGTFDAVKSGFKPSDTAFVDRHGEIVQRVRTDFSVRRGNWVALTDMSPALRTALVLSEDQRFWQHSGVDWRAVSSAAWGNLFNRKTRGASTLTMQLAGLLDADLKPGKDGRSISQKIGQTISSQALEQNWRKDEILEAYLNLVPFRGELVGIAALSQTLFGKAPSGLNATESAIAVALVRAPNAPHALVAQRACGVQRAVQAMDEALPVVQKAAAASKPTQPASTLAAKALTPSTPGNSAKPEKADCESIALLTEAALQRRGFEASAGFAPHWAQQVVSAHRATAAQLAKVGAAVPNSTAKLGATQSHSAGGNTANPAALALIDPPATTLSSGIPTTLRTSLRADVQRLAVQALTQQLRELRGHQVEDGAALVLDNATGEVLAWVGSSGSEFSAAAHVDGVLALRQPGSTLKPFLYAQAIAEQRLTAASLLDDSSAQIPTASGLYIPQNYDRQFKGPVSVRTALGASLNVPAVRALVMVSPDAFFKQLTALGLPMRESGGYYGYSLALGGSETSLLALTNAYRTLANGGRYGPVRLTPGAAVVNTTSRQAIDAKAAFIITDILADPLARARTFGLDSVLSTRFWSAVKTGTSKDMRDNWAIGYSSRYTVGVWVGNASGAPMWDVSGTSGAAPVWAQLIRHLHEREPSRAPSGPPPGVSARTIVFADGTEAGRSEWFINGTEQETFAINSVAARAGNSGLAGIKSTQKGAKNAVFGSSGASSNARITAPANGTIIALDPDIPPNRQRLHFAAESGGAGQKLTWKISSHAKPFAQGPTAQWLPWPGKHRVELLDAQGRMLDGVMIEVRGAGVVAGVAARR